MPHYLHAVAARQLSRILSLLALSFILGLGASRSALAQSAMDRATAESLFNEALALLANKNSAEACRKLEESQRLDPGVGTLLYLADCYQQIGRTASAWATFREAAYMAKDKADEREPVAIEYARTLEPKLSYLTLEVAAQPDVALEIKQDGKLVGQAVWGMASPVDPGLHTIEASAPGKKPWSETVNISEGERQHRVVVPELLDAEPEKLAVVAPPPPPVMQPSEPRVVSSTQKTVGWVLLGVGSAAIVTGGVLALLARGDDSDAAAQCRPDRVSLCGPAGVELGESARSKATWAGVSAGAGLLALGAGVTLLLTAPTSDATADIALAAMASADGGRLSLTAIW